MRYIKFTNISKEYHGREVLDGITFEINSGQKIGLIGANGSGKSTILKILCGLEKPTEGNVFIAPSVRIGYVPQHVEFHRHQSVEDYLLQDHRDLKRRLQTLEQQLERTPEEKLPRQLAEYQQAHDAFERNGGAHFEQQAKAMLEALGLGEHLDRKIDGLSGGEKNVLGMTRALLENPNLLVLDEPGNHLDYLGLLWLEDFLRRFRGAVLIVSHNRYLLDKLVDSILELEYGKINIFPGNYSAYRRIKEEQQRSRESQYEADQKRIAHLEKLVRKFADIAQGHASDNTWGKRLRARRSQLEREKAKASEKPLQPTRQVTARFISEQTQADIALQLKNYSKKYGDTVLLENINLQICGGQRWALVGSNGCGKTSLLRDIVEKGSWKHPHIRIGPSLCIGYCAQEQEVLDGDNTVFEELFSLPGTTNERVLGILARFLFTDAEIYKKIKNLSGGERNRLQLARLMLLNPNFLILDEPTNHLDIPTREAIEMALSEFKGTILLVSHDRYFLDKVVDHIALIKNKTIHIYEGNFSAFQDKLQYETGKITGHIAVRGKSRRNKAPEKAKIGGQTWRERKAQAAAERKRLKAITQLEETITKSEERKKRLEEQIARAFSTGDNDAGNELSKQLTALLAELDLLYAEWEKIQL